MSNCKYCNSPISWAEINGRNVPLNPDGSQHRCQTPTQKPRSRGAPAYDPRQFISNCVASAIQAGAIKEPNEIREWCLAAYDAIQNLRTTPTQQAIQQPTIQQPMIQQYDERNPPPMEDVPW